MSAEPDHLANLRRAIWESPGDDAPRLVYADAVEECGGCDRALLIRLQVEAAARPGRVRKATIKRELLDLALRRSVMLSYAWLLRWWQGGAAPPAPQVHADLSISVGVGPTRVFYRRGFPGAITTTAGSSDVLDTVRPWVAAFPVTDVVWPTCPVHRAALNRATLSLYAGVTGEPFSLPSALREFMPRPLGRFGRCLYWNFQSDRNAIRSASRALLRWGRESVRADAAPASV